MRGTAINYDHERNTHTVLGAQSALKLLFTGDLPGSVLDVGCGIGTWLRAALDLGMNDVYGLDGVAIPEQELLFPIDRFKQQDLTQRWLLGRRFDVIFCLEVAEHLPAASADNLVTSLVEHSDFIFFSAAVPGQSGQNHVNCQWPEYWQAVFNTHGFVCDDWPRERIWGVDNIEPWYRQNLFCAYHDPIAAGTEQRLRSVLHPTMLAIKAIDVIPRVELESGVFNISWYLRLLGKAGMGKLMRRARGFGLDHRS